MSWLIVQLVGFGFLLLLSGLFSSSEVAYTGLSLTQLKRINQVQPGVLGIWERSPDRVLATLLLSNNAVNTGVGVMAASLALELSEAMQWPQSLVTISLGLFASGLVLLFGEIIPKIYAKKYSVTWALNVTPFITFWSQLISPFSKAAMWATQLLFRGRRLSFKQKSPFLQPNELKRILTHSVLPMGSIKILSNVMEFSQSKVEDAMTHNSEVFAVSIQEPMKNIILSVIQSGFSRVPVYSGSLDSVRGILYAKDLLVAWRSGQLLVLEDLLRPIKTVPSNMPLPELMRLLRAGRQHLAMVVDHANPKRVTGIITLEDALEAIVGQIRDEA